MDKDNELVKIPGDFLNDEESVALYLALHAGSKTSSHETRYSGIVMSKVNEQGVKRYYVFEGEGMDVVSNFGLGFVASFKNIGPEEFDEVNRRAMERTGRQFDLIRILKSNNAEISFSE